MGSTEPSIRFRRCQIRLRICRPFRPESRGRCYPVPPLSTDAPRLPQFVELRKKLLCVNSSFRLRQTKWRIGRRERQDFNIKRCCQGPPARCGPDYIKHAGVPWRPQLRGLTPEVTNTGCRWIVRIIRIAARALIYSREVVVRRRAA